MARKQKVQTSVKAELEAFDSLPTTLRKVLNYNRECLDPRYIFGMYKTQGLKATLGYLDSIGLLDGEYMSSEKIYDTPRTQ